VAKNGLYANIHAKQARIAAGSGEHMNKVGSKNAPTAKDFKESAKTAKKTRRHHIENAMKGY
jgi:signal recognition particle GTPase